MSVLIKGMEMPKEGSWITLRVFPDGQCFLYSWCGNDFDFMEHLTAVPVPPHGDLIDRDPFIEFIKTHWDSFDQWFVEQLEARPTIIPAEEGE